MSEEQPSSSSSGSNSGQSPSGIPARSRGYRGRHRGRWRRFRPRRSGETIPNEPTLPAVEVLDMQALAALSEKELKGRAAELGVEEDFKTFAEAMPIFLKAHASRQGLFLGSGILEIGRNGSGFLRSPENFYEPAKSDPLVSSRLIRDYKLLPGDKIMGMVHPAGPRDRYPNLAHVDLIWDVPSAKMLDRKSFEELTPLFPNKRLVLETDSKGIGMRALDLLAPLGRGQRCLLVAPPRAGKTILMQQIAQSVEKNDPDAEIIVLLLDERPEEVYNMKRMVRGEVVASTFDETVERHVRMAELVTEKAHRMLQNGKHVVLFLDSLTRLARACNAISSSKGKLMSGGIESSALSKPRKFFSAARNVEEGGSLTIVATVLVETGSRADDLIFEEFKGTGNMEVYLSRDLQERRIYPAIHIEKSGTRREDLLYHPDELVRVQALRKKLSEFPPLEAMERLIEMLEGTDSNAELLMRLKVE